MPARSCTRPPQASAEPSHASVPSVQPAFFADNKNVVSANAASPSGAGSATGGTARVALATSGSVRMSVVYAIGHLRPVIAANRLEPRRPGESRLTSQEVTSDSSPAPDLSVHVRDVAGNQHWR